MMREGLAVPARSRQRFSVIAVPSSRPLTRLQKLCPEFTTGSTDHTQFFGDIHSVRPENAIGIQSHEPPYQYELADKIAITGGSRLLTGEIAQFEIDNAPMDFIPQFEHCCIARNHRILPFCERQ